MRVALVGFMQKPKRKDNGAPQHAGDTTNSAVLDRDRLAQRAYELYLARGGADGQDMDDWLSAERELRQLTNPNSEQSS